MSDWAQGSWMGPLLSIVAVTAALSRYTRVPQASSSARLRVCLSSERVWVEARGRCRYYKLQA
eukprot:3299253-Rhodomonas_salina.1